MSRWKSLSVLFVCLLMVSLPIGAVELPDFTQLVKDNNAAVVNISTTQKIETAHPRLPPEMQIPDDSQLGDLFRHFFGQPGGQPRQREAYSLGSGFIISKDGYVLTNHHVIRDADEVVIRLSDRRELVAAVIGSDERTDLALLKVDASDLPVVKLGSSKALEVGEWVFAIGSPFGFEHSVTAGIVSAKQRSLPSENYVPFIQTDVAINPGNSGGPLFNMDGEVVGINSQIYSRTGGFMGLSFAIPIDVALNVADQLKTKGKVSRGWLGVLIQDVTRELAESFDMDRPHGALVAKIIPGSPAEKAGFKLGDIIVAFNDKTIDRSADLPPIVGASSLEDKSIARVLREGKVVELKVKLEQLPEDEAVEASNPAEPASDQFLGMRVIELSDEMRSNTDVPEGGVFVKSLEAGPALDAGIRPGDVVLQIGSSKVKDVDDFKTLIRALPEGKSTAILIQRQGSPTFLALKP